MHEIALATSRHFSLRLADVRSSVRRRALVTARGVAVYLARHCAGKSLQEIGRYFGGRDHTTVMHSCRQTEQMSESDPTIHEAIETVAQGVVENVTTACRPFCRPVWGINTTTPAVRKTPIHRLSINPIRTANQPLFHQNRLRDCKPNIKPAMMLRWSSARLRTLRAGILILLLVD